MLLSDAISFAGEKKVDGPNDTLLIKKVTKDVFRQTIGQYLSPEEMGRAACASEIFGDIFATGVTRKKLQKGLSRNTKGINLAMEAAKNGDLKSLKVLYRNARNTLLQKNIGGENLAHFAAKNGQINILQFLVIKYPEFFEQNSVFGAHYPLVDAVLQNNVKAMQVIVTAFRETGKMILRQECSDSRWTAAVAAGIFTKWDAFKWIAENDPESLQAKLQWRQREWGFFSHRFAYKNSVEGLEIIERFAPELLKTIDDYGNTPAHAAANGGSINALEYLWTKVPETFSWKSRKGPRGDCKRTIVHDAASAYNVNGEGRLLVVKYLFDVVPEIFEEVDSLGNNIAHESNSFIDIDCNLEIFEFLASKMPRLFEIQNNRGNTPAHDLLLDFRDYKGIIKPILNSLRIIIKVAPGILKIRNMHGETVIELLRNQSSSSFIDFAAELEGML